MMKHMAGPAIHAVDPWVPSNLQPGERHQLLSEDERAELIKISTVVRFEKGQKIYGDGGTADAAFNIIDGVVAAYRVVQDTEHVLSFLYSGDLFGLSEEGKYTNATRAATAVTAYKMPLPALRRLLHRNAELDVDVIVKLCEGVREAQRHAVLLAQNKAATRLAMFLSLQEHLQAARGEPVAEIHLPMDRSSIAAYLGLTLAALSRAFKALVVKKIISMRNLHWVTVVDRTALDELADARPAAI